MKGARRQVRAAATCDAHALASSLSRGGIGAAAARGRVLGVVLVLGRQRGPILLAVDGHQRVLAQPRRRPVVDDLAGAQADDAGDEHLRQRHVVDVDDGSEAPLGADLGDQPHDLRASLWIEARGRLIDEQEFRVLLQRAGDSDTLALAAGERVGPLVDMLAQADAIEQAERLVDVGLREAPQERAPEGT